MTFREKQPGQEFLPGLFLPNFLKIRTESDPGSMI